MTARALERRLNLLVARDALLRSAREVARASGCPLWLVGGSIRDTALRTRPEDLDFVAGKGIAKLLRGLESAWGRRAFRFRKRGVTTWRMTIEGRKVDVVDAARRGLATDLLRRELTINAVAFDLVGGSVFDPLRGLADLRSRRLSLPRAGVVREDPIRALRAARFLAMLPGFRLTPEARKEIVSAAPKVRRSSVERVRDELDRLLTSKAPAMALDAMASLGLIEPTLPELVPLRSCPAGQGRPDTWTHTLLALALAAGPSRLPGRTSLDAEAVRLLRWTLLLHDIAKPTTLRMEGERPTFHGHEVRGAKDADRLLKRLKLPAAFRRRVCRLVLFHLRPHHLADAGAPERGVRRLVRDAGPDLPVLVLHAACDAKASGAPDGAARWRRLRPVLGALLKLHRESQGTPLPRLIDGDDVMRSLCIEPGPAVGRALQEVRELQEQGSIRDRAEALRHLASQRSSV